MSHVCVAVFCSVLQCATECCSERRPEHVNESSCAYGYSAPLMLQSVAVTDSSRVLCLAVKDDTACCSDRQL